MGNKMIHPDISSDESKDSLHDGAPNQVCDLTDNIESEIDANVVLDMGGIIIPSSLCRLITDIAPITSSFDDFSNNDVNIRRRDKSRYTVLCKYISRGQIQSG